MAGAPGSHVEDQGVTPGRPAVLGPVERTGDSDSRGFLLPPRGEKTGGTRQDAGSSREGTARALSS